MTRPQTSHACFPIETMLSLRSALPAMPMVAALSAAHLSAILFPDSLRRLYIARDDDPAGGGAMATLIDRANATLAFWRFAQNPRSSPAPRIKLPRPSGKTLEFAFLAWVLDLKWQGATDRELAKALFCEAPTDWEDGGRRSQVRRFLAKARAFAVGRYRLLLKPERESRSGG